MSQDPRKIMNDSSMSAVQIIAVAITIGLNALDGFDVLSISFASPGIVADWGIQRGALGIVLSMEMLGMGIGAITLGGLADKMGRRHTIMLCLVLMLIGMLLSANANSIIELSLFRVLTGLGIGGMLAATNATVAEFANAKWRTLCVSLMAIGYPIGATVGGTIASGLLANNDWQIVFQFGAIVTACFIPLVWFLIPESPSYLTDKQPKGALESINKTFKRMGHPHIESLPVLTPAEQAYSVSDIFSPALIQKTILITLAYFMHIATFYFILKWVPVIVVDMGFNPSTAGGVLVWANIGGAIGGGLFGLLAMRYSLRWLTIGVMFISVPMIIIFGNGYTELSTLAIAAASAGFFTNAGVVGLYTLVATSFPTHVRATATGFVIGVGRAGAFVSPIIAGYMFQSGLGLQTVAIFMACGSLIAGFALIMLGRKLNAASSATA
ncbi:MAG: MFS transporter [SAR86 cluster bacterium]|uniref:MFS transporter n=1 Tax=SAR86 cluster bacterium TaxID=2030880 RepID=A0A2A5C8L7_9GAMM|nr:MAG: MFS transporter [SAR86 cluster bacterium]